MPWIKLPDGSVAHVRVARGKPVRCRWCEKKHTHRCDFPVTSRKGDKRSCDAPMCEEHRTPVGGGDIDVDHCPNHATRKDTT